MRLGLVLVALAATLLVLAGCEDKPSEAAKAAPDYKAKPTKPAPSFGAGGAAPAAPNTNAKTSVQ